MSLTNTPQSYGAVARTLHWLTALLILTAIPLGLVASDLPYDTAAALAQKAQVFSLHKTVGVAAFAVAVLRILWALTQARPVPVHPGRRAETLLADLVHWSLYIALVAVPLSGWIEHAATEGFAPILWPLGQGLPLVPKSETLARLVAGAHLLFGKLLIGAILLHVAGALKHAVIDRDGTLARMTRGTAAPARATAAAHGKGPAAVALAIYVAAAGAVVALGGNGAPPVPQTAGTATETVPATAASGNWAVTEGTLGFTIRQMGADVQGTFGTWTADIAFDPGTGTGSVTVAIDVASLTLGSVTQQALSADFFDAAGYPAATFTATIRPDAGAFVAEGTLTLRGVTVPVTLPFALDLDGKTARMSGAVVLERLAYGIGQKYPDGQSVGTSAAVRVALTATRK